MAKGDVELNDPQSVAGKDFVRRGTALVYARATKCRILHAMAGLCPAGRDRAEAERTYLANLRHAADRLAGEGLTLVIEPINTRDIPGYFLNTTTQAMSIIERTSASAAEVRRQDACLVLAIPDKPGYKDAQPARAAADGSAKRDYFKPPEPKKPVLH
jgi:hypothetical protein